MSEIATGPHLRQTHEIPTTGEEVNGHAVHSYEIGAQPFVINPAEVGSFESLNDTKMIGSVELGNGSVKLYASQDTDGSYIYVAASEAHDASAGSNGEAIIFDFVLVKDDEPLTIGRRNEKLMKRLGLDGDDMISRNHLSLAVNAQGLLEVRDLESTNGTKLKTLEKKQSNEGITAEHAHSIGQLALHENVNVPASIEQKIGDITYRFEGRVQSASGREVYAFTSRASNNEVRNMMVYRSNSEGALRVTQGQEAFMSADGTMGWRYMKGAELSDFHQYTQETQLHPDFEAMVLSLGKVADEAPMLSGEHLMVNAVKVQQLMEDFASQVEVTGFHDNRLTQTLAALKAGDYSRNSLTQAFGAEYVADSAKKMQQYLSELNDSLEKAGIVPDFNQPIETHTVQHPLLGSVIKEVFKTEAHGLGYEWHMARDESGRVWIDRMRYSDAEQTAYGTDKQVLYSGILTSKPLEYQSQVSGLPDEMVQDFEGGRGAYADITKMLDTFMPLQKYRRQRNIMRKNR